MPLGKSAENYSSPGGDGKKLNRFRKKRNLSSFDESSDGEIMDKIKKMRLLRLQNDENEAEKNSDQIFENTEKQEQSQNHTDDFPPKPPAQEETFSASLLGASEFRFGAAELAANKEGMFTPKQQEFIQRQKKGIAFIISYLLYGILGSAIGALCYFFLFQESEFHIITFISIGFLLGIIVAYIKQGSIRIYTTEGIVSIPKNSRGKIQINSLVLNSPYQYQKFEEGQRYKIYYIFVGLTDKLVVSFEYLGKQGI